jgi:outer membrane lipoprotein-sorting protein
MNSTILALFASTLLIAAPQQEIPSVDQVLTKLEAAFDELSTFTVNFRQEELDEIIDDTSVTEGEIFFQSPGKVLLQRHFEGKVIEEVGRTAEVAWRTRHSMKAIDKFKVTTSAESEGFDLMTVFSSTSEMKRYFDLEVVGIEELASGPAYHLIGVAKEKLKIKKIEFWVDVEDAAPPVKAIAHQRRVKTTIILTDIKKGLTLDTNLFQYKVPRGYSEKIH